MQACRSRQDQSWIALTALKHVHTESLQYITRLHITWRDITRVFVRRGIWHWVLRNRPTCLSNSGLMRRCRSCFVWLWFEAGGQNACLGRQRKRKNNKKHTQVKCECNFCQASIQAKLLRFRLSKKKKKKKNGTRILLLVLVITCRQCHFQRSFFSFSQTVTVWQFQVIVHARAFCQSPGETSEKVIGRPTFYAVFLFLLCKMVVSQSYCALTFRETSEKNTITDQKTRFSFCCLFFCFLLFPLFLFLSFIKFLFCFFFGPFIVLFLFCC